MALLLPNCQSGSTSIPLAAGVSSDTAQVQQRIDRAWEIYEDSADIASEYLNQAIALSQQADFPSGEAAALNALAAVEKVRDNYPQAFRHYREALAIRQRLGDRRGMAALHNNLGLAYEDLEQYDSALVQHRLSLHLVEELNDTARVARAHFNMAGVFEANGEYTGANNHLKEARLALEMQRDTDGIAKAYGLLGHIQFELDQYANARTWYEKSLGLREYLGEPGRLAGALTDLGNTLDELGNAQNQPDTVRAGINCYFRALGIFKNLADSAGMANVYLNLGDAYKHLKDLPQAESYARQALAIHQSIGNRTGLMEAYNLLGDVAFREQRFQDALQHVGRYQQIAEGIDNQKFTLRAKKDFSKIYAVTGDYTRAYDYRVQYDDLRYKLLDEGRAKDLARSDIDYEYQKTRQEYALQREKSDRAATEFRLRQRVAFGGIAGLLILAGLLFNRNLLRARINRELATKNDQIETERRRADELLTNILPEATAAELKKYNTVRPVRHDSVTVMFTDFKGFTKIAEQAPPEDLIDELDECFRMFDGIVEQFGLEKIKTIGDSYMCAGGLPTPNDTHPEQMVQAAVAMHLGLRALMTRKAAEGKPVFEMRIGIHTGPVVAGVVGSRKFAYDIWGDTVNTAARLEQGSEEGKINISAATYERIKHLYPCTFRGELPAKNKGTIPMYFVEYEDAQSPTGKDLLP